MDRWVSGWIDRFGWVDGLMGGAVCGWMDGLIDGWMGR